MNQGPTREQKPWEFETNYSNNLIIKYMNNVHQLILLDVEAKKVTVKSVIYPVTIRLRWRIALEDL